MHPDLGTYIRTRRRHLGLNQVQLAERVGDTYDQGDISRLERGGVELPRLRTLSKLAAALEVPVGNFLIAAGWFDDGHFATMPTLGEAVEQDTLEMALSDIEAGLATMLELEGEATSRSDRLRAMIRELQ